MCPCVCVAAVPQPSCLDQYCSEHEFCGERLGEASCFCRALFASKFNPTNALGTVKHHTLQQVEDLKWTCLYLCDR